MAPHGALSRERSDGLGSDSEAYSGSFHGGGEAVAEALAQARGRAGWCARGGLRVSYGVGSQQGAQRPVNGP